MKPKFPSGPATEKKIKRWYGKLSPRDKIVIRVMFRNISTEVSRLEKERERLGLDPFNQSSKIRDIIDHNWMKTMIQEVVDLVSSKPQGTA